MNSAALVTTSRLSDFSEFPLSMHASIQLTLCVHPSMYVSVSVCACMHVSVHNIMCSAGPEVAVLDWYGPEADPVYWRRGRGGWWWQDFR